MLIRRCSNDLYWIRNVSQTSHFCSYFGYDVWLWVLFLVCNLHSQHDIHASNSTLVCALHIYFGFIRPFYRRVPFEITIITNVLSNETYLEAGKIPESRILLQLYYSGNENTVCIFQIKYGNMKKDVPPFLINIVKYYFISLNYMICLRKNISIFLGLFII